MFATLYKPLSESAPTWAAAKITDIFKIISYNYTKKFYEVGSFSMVIPVNEPSAELLETNTFLATSDGDYLFVTDIKEAESRITLEGHDLKYLLAGRITLFPTEEQDKGTYGYYVTKGSTGKCICDIVSHNINEASDPDRRIYGFSVTYSPFGIQNDTYMTRLEPLDQVVGTLCKNAGIGYDVEMRFDPAFGDSIAFQVLNPTDRSADQTNVPKMIFSTNFLNVEALSRETGVDSEKNAIYAINGTNIDDAVVKLVNRDEDKASFGVYRRETTVNVNCDIDEIDSYALKEAEDFITTDSFVMDVMAVESYKRDWFVGDIVTFQHKGVRRNVPIIAAEVQRTADKFTVKLSAGETVNKPVSMINRKSDKAVNEITQKKFDDGYVTVVKELPEEGKKNKIYVLEEEQAGALTDDPGETGGSSDTVSGFVFVDGQWKKIGAEGGGTTGDGVGEFTNEAKNSEIFNDYEKNYINPQTAYAHVSGSTNYIDRDENISNNFSQMAAILGGVSNQIKQANLSVIIGGTGNNIVRGLISCIAAGVSNMCESQLSFIGGGNGNKILNSSANSSVICGGSSNKIENTSNSGIVAGSQNAIKGSMSYQSAIIGGYNNAIEEGYYNAIIGGIGNKISHNSWACIFSGSNNKTVAATSTASNLTCCFVCGNANQLKGASNCIVCGEYGIAEYNHRLVIGNGRFEDPYNVFYVDDAGNVYAKSFNIIGETASEVSTFSARSADNPDLSELTAQISEIKADIEALRAENAALRAEIAALK